MNNLNHSQLNVVLFYFQIHVFLKIHISLFTYGIINAIFKKNPEQETKTKQNIKNQQPNIATTRSNQPY